MMKTVTLLLLLFYCIPYSLFAKHGKGGSITYEYLGAGSSTGTSKYRITVKHYIDCNSSNLIEANVYVGIFTTGSSSVFKTLNIARTTTTTMQKTSFSVCINPQPSVCFYVVSYITETDLADNSEGYTISEQECCRIDGIINIANSSGYGITNTNTIPGAINGIVYRQNTSPVYAQKDTAVICYNSYFTIDFSATDADNDSLSYSFCAALAGASMQQRQPNPPTAPPYSTLPYQSVYTAAAPLGSQVSIDAKTGLISGIAPGTTGQYVISVCVSEFREGVQIGITKKEVHVNVAACSLTAATLKTSYINCDDFNFNFKNESTASNVDQYAWDFGVTTLTSDVSTQPTPAYTYPDTGTFVLKLKVSTTAGCLDSSTSTVRVYPGFKPGFTVSGRCYLLPFQFTDTTYARYGTVNSWSWNFGDGNTSTAQSPSYQYATAGTRSVAFLVGSSKGCSSLVTQQVTADNKPQLTLPFHDTLICSIDTLPLKAIGTGNFTWTPASYMLNANTANPLVFPKDTITYVVNLDENGCTSSDSIKVNVLDFITVKLPADTTICATDAFTLHPVSDALQYQWSPAATLSNATIKNPVAKPLVNTTYSVTANLGKCQDITSMLVKLIPYPTVVASNDTTICYSKTTQLHATMVAASFTWSPAASLLYSRTLNPVAGPQQTTSYVITVNDVLGCPKPVTDTVVVTVIPRIPANAGNDTTIVAGQPLQLQASGGYTYSWSPATGLSNTAIANPVAILGTTLDSILYTVRVTTPEGCSATDQVNVKVFKTMPDIFVPTAFTPNSDGRNDILVPIPVGMKNISFFRIYNRWGELMFSTNAIGKGWNGTFSGTAQPAGTYVFMAEGTDYTGKVLQRKGTTVLIR
jgi:gliding motility-associated-like protein